MNCILSNSKIAALEFWRSAALRQQVPGCQRREAALRTGGVLTIASDGWTGLKKDSLQNVVISNSESAFFLKQEKLVGKGTDDVISREIWAQMNIVGTGRPLPDGYLWHRTRAGRYRGRMSAPFL